MSRTRYKFKGYTITNCGYHQPDHCVWWEAVDENGEACFHGHSLREVEFMILDDEWEKKLREKDAEIERLKHSSVGNAAAMREALEFLRDKELDLLEGNVRRCVGLTVFGLEQACKIMRGVIEEALSDPARNCDRPECATSKAAQDVWRKEDGGKTPYYEWILAPAAERKGATA